MVFIKTDKRNCFSLNFLLRLDLVELDFSWNNTLMSCPIDFYCKRNKSPMWLCCLHLEMVKNMHSVSPLSKEQPTRLFLSPNLSAPHHSVPPHINLWESSFQLKAIFTFGDNTCSEYSQGLPSIISPQVTALLLTSPVSLQSNAGVSQRGHIFPLEMFKVKIQEVLTKLQQTLMSFKIVFRLQAITRENKSFSPTCRILHIIFRFCYVEPPRHVTWYSPFIQARRLPSK